MSAELATVTAAVQKNRLALGSLASAVNNLTDVGEIHEVRARIEALRAWAKVHKQLREIRVDLLRAEVAALVRVVQLGGADDLATTDRRAAEFLADLTPAARERFIAQSAATVATATGMVRTLWAIKDAEERARSAYERGRDEALNPSRRVGGVIGGASRPDVGDVLRSIMDDYSNAGEPFTVADIADEILERARISNDVSDDDSLMGGVREVCRRAIRRAPSLDIDGTPLPRMVTTRMDDGAFIRIPTENATLAHLDEMRAIRREQLAQDQAALDRLDAVAAILRAAPGAGDDARIGDLLANLLSARPVATPEQAAS